MEQTENGKKAAVKSVSQVRPGQELDVYVTDGQIHVRAEKIREASYGRK